MPEFDDDLEVQPLTIESFDIGEDNSSAVRGSSASKKRVNKTKVSDKVSFSILKKFPTSFIKIAQMEFPDAQNQTDAVVAYLYCNCPEVAMNNSATFALTDAQKQLIHDHEKNAFEDFNSRLQTLSKKIDKISDENLFIKMITLYHLYDRIGITDAHGNRYSPENAKNFDITDGGHFLDFADDMDAQQKNFKQQTNYRKGNPW